MATKFTFGAFCALSLTLMLMSGCAAHEDSPASEVSLEGRLYPKIQVPATSLAVADLSGDSIEGQVAAIGLQGLVNRSSENKIYVINSRCADNHGNWEAGDRSMIQMGRFWLDNTLQDIPKEYITVSQGENDPAFKELLFRYKDYVKGVVIYDPALEQATIEAATTIAAQKDALILSPRLFEETAGYGFPVIEDLRGRFASNIECLDWLTDNYFDSARHDVAFTWSHMTTDPETSWGAANKDYVVANKLFTFFLDIEKPEECAYYENIIKRYPAGTPIMGWTDELKADKLFADYGYVMVPYISVENLSVMSSFPSVKGERVSPKSYEIDSSTVCVAFLVSDGDNLEHTMDYIPNTISNSDTFGEVPITWIINPAITDLAPRAFSWYAGKAGAAGQELGAMMGDGSPDPERYTGFSFYCALCRHYIDQAGIGVVKQMIGGEAVAYNVRPYVLQGGYSGTDWRGIGPYECHMDGETFHVGTTNHAPEYLDAVLDNAPSGQPLFLTVAIVCAHADSPSHAVAVKERLLSRNDGREYVFMRVSDLAATFRKYYNLR